MPPKKIIVGLPKGSLEKHTLKILETAGFNIEPPGRSHHLTIDDPELECILLRPQEIPRYVEEGRLDAGISGSDWILESGTKVVEVANLRYAKETLAQAKWVLAVSESSSIKTIKDLRNKTISTEIVNIVKDYLKKKKIKARVEFSWGATEAKPPYFADAIVDLTETGASLKANKLRVLDTIIESKAKLIANRAALKNKWKGNKIKALATLMSGVVEGETSVILTTHVKRRALTKVLKILPSFKKPTVHKIAGENWYDLTFGARKKEVRELIPRLKRLGCVGIIEMPLTTFSP